ncbi:MAG: DUF4013 domain-containing protein [Anaerolineae bacterium]
MDFAKALTYPFEDDDWLKKVGLAVLIQFIPIIGQMVIQGWTFETSKNVRINEPAPMVNWQFGELLGRGFILFIASLIYQIPTILFACGISFVFVLPAFAGSEDAAAALAGTASLIAICCSCLIVIYAIAAQLVYIAGWVRFIDQPELSTFLQFGDNIALFRENIGDFGQAILFLIGGGILGSIVASLTAGLGSLLLQPFLAYFSAHIFGQLAQKVGGTPAVPAV